MTFNFQNKKGVKIMKEIKETYKQKLEKIELLLNKIISGEKGEDTVNSN